jgi:hypothetical protein
VSSEVRLMRSGRQASTTKNVFDNKLFFFVKPESFSSQKFIDQLITSQTFNIQQNIENDPKLIFDF